MLSDQSELTEIVFEAIERTGQRALISRGWGNLRVDNAHVPDNVLVIGSCPHDWLFRQVSCVIHHGGAGTTAAGLDLAAAARALSHPKAFTDPLAGCHWHTRLRQGNTASEGGQGRDDSADALENTTCDEGEEYSNNSLSGSGTQRRRIIPLETEQTMSTEVRVSRTRNILAETAIHGSGMSKRLFNLAIWLPADLSLSLAKGFRNAPKLYHDPMVKADPKVVGLRSGSSVAGKVCSILPSVSNSLR